MRDGEGLSRSWMHSQPKLNLVELETRMVQRSRSVPAGSVQLAQDSLGFGSVKSLKGYPMERKNGIKQEALFQVS